MFTLVILLALWLRLLLLLLLFPGRYLAIRPQFGAYNIAQHTALLEYKHFWYKIHIIWTRNICNVYNQQYIMYYAQYTHTQQAQKYDS